MSNKTAVIIGAGPAGLTAAFELLTRTDVRPILIEKEDVVGGLSKTVVYKGNRIDIGPHRFFSKSDRIMNWWLKMIPLETTGNETETITYQQQSRHITPEPSNLPSEHNDKGMIVIKRQTRIYFMRKFFDYPISLKFATLQKLGLNRTIRIGLGYLKAILFPIRPEKNLEEFFINRFGLELYRTFFKDYTEKVWGISCKQISAAWGAQRIKGLSIFKAVMHSLQKIISTTCGIKQTKVETSLIEQFLFPKLGTGQMWEEVAFQLKSKGVEILLQSEVDQIVVEENRIVSLSARNLKTGAKRTLTGDYFFSTMPIKELVCSLTPPAPESVRYISDGLVYRDFIEVGLLVNKLKISEPSNDGHNIADNWIYIQEPDVKAGRLQIWNNWGSKMVADPSKVWLGLEYFCNEGDELWQLSNDEIINLATYELDKIGIAAKEDVVDAMVLRVPKTYPGYFGTYEHFDELRSYLDEMKNLFLIGRNGQHKYNNQDHSMLTAMVAVDTIIDRNHSKERIWAVNTEAEYHEEK